MKQFFEFLPIALFVVVYIVTRDIFISTAVLMAGMFAQVVFEYVTYRKVEKKTLVIFWVAMVFGGLTLLLRDQTFIQWKPTIVNWLFAVALLASQFFGKNLLESALGGQLELPTRAWRTLNYGWSFGFILAGVLNLVVAYQFSLDFWVTYKLVGGFGLTFVYIIITFAYLARAGHLKPIEAGEREPVNPVPPQDG